MLQACARGAPEQTGPPLLALTGAPSGLQPEPSERQEGLDPEGAAGATAPDHPATLLPAALPILRPLLRVRTGPYKWRGPLSAPAPVHAFPSSQLPPSLGTEHPLCAVLGVTISLAWPSPAPELAGRGHIHAGVKQHQLTEGRATRMVAGADFLPVR